MTGTSLIRSLRFPASHHYWRSDWSEDENRRKFGANVEPHEHEYTLEVTLYGKVDPFTGFLTDLGALDRALEDVVGPLRGRSLVDTIPEVRSGALLPSTENLARWFFERLDGAIPPPARLGRVRVWESPTLGAGYEGAGR